jgi:hypothetical protein
MKYDVRVLKEGNPNDFAKYLKNYLNDSWERFGYPMVDKNGYILQVLTKKVYPSNPPPPPKDWGGITPVQPGLFKRIFGRL